MNRSTPLDDGRLDALLADLAAQGLDESARAELDRLLGPLGSAEAAAMERAAAALDLALGPADHPPLPAGLRERILADAEVAFRRDGERTGPAILRIVPRVVPWLGWVAAAACAVLLLRIEPDSTPTRPDNPRSRREALIRSGPVAVVSWATPPPPAARLEVWDGAADRVLSVPLGSTAEPGPAVAGDVVWSEDRQEGYLRFLGLEPNDRSRFQYQLWIVDAERDPRYPVDGGVFDIRPGVDGEAVVAIRPTLGVRRPTLFAVTREPPGGVVVSDRSAVIATASLGGR